MHRNAYLKYVGAVTAVEGNEQFLLTPVPHDDTEIIGTAGDQ